MRTAIVGVTGAILVALVVLHLVSRRRLLVKYATLWLVVSCVLVILAVVPDALSWLATVLGFAVPANLLFFAGFVLVLFVTVQLSVELTAVERRIQRLAEELTILRESRDRSADS